MKISGDRGGELGLGWGCIYRCMAGKREFVSFWTVCARAFDFHDWGNGREEGKRQTPGGV